MALPKETVDSIESNLAAAGDNKLAVGRVVALLKNFVVHKIATLEELKTAFPSVAGLLEKPVAVSNKSREDVEAAKKEFESVMLGFVESMIEAFAEDGIVAKDVLRGRNATLSFVIDSDGKLSNPQAEVKVSSGIREHRSPEQVLGENYKGDKWVTALAKDFFGGNVEAAKAATKTGENSMSAHAAYGWLLKERGVPGLSWDSLKSNFPRIVKPNIEAKATKQKESKEDKKKKK